MHLTVGAITMNSQPHIADNLKALRPLLVQARDRGATFISTPENVSLMTFGRDNYLAEIAPEDQHPAVAWFADQAKALGVWLQAGSLAVPVADGRIANRCYVFSPDGAIAARYDKIHMFDVDLPGGESYRESAAFRPGEQGVLVKTPFATIGLSVCYDVRFAALYRVLAKAGAEIITIPAAFTRQTGEAHWHILMRARAIETGCYIIAAAQTGTHIQGRQTYGHSLIIDPWGEVLADGGTEPGVITALIDLTKVTDVRSRIPALKHDRPLPLAVVPAA